MGKIKTYNKKQWDEARSKNEYMVIPISKLPDDCPVLVVNQMPNKSLAEFHLAELVLVPLSFKPTKRKPNAK